MLSGDLDWGVERVAVRDHDLDRLIGTADHLRHAVDLRHDRLALGDARLEELLDARQALRDVLAGDAAGVEGPHGELGSRLADRLGRDDPHRLAESHEVAGRQVTPVAHAAHAVTGLAGQR